MVSNLINNVNAIVHGLLSLISLVSPFSPVSSLFPVSLSSPSVHKYLDSDNSGTHDDCVTNNIDTFQALVDFLKQNGNRQALLSESGGGNTDSCKQL